MPLLETIEIEAVFVLHHIQIGRVNKFTRNMPN